MISQKTKMFLFTLMCGCSFPIDNGETNDPDTSTRSDDDMTVVRETKQFIANFEDVHHIRFKSNKPVHTGPDWKDHTICDVIPPKTDTVGFYYVKKMTPHVLDCSDTENSLLGNDYFEVILEPRYSVEGSPQRTVYLHVQYRPDRLLTEDTVILASTFRDNGIDIISNFYELDAISKKKNERLDKTSGLDIPTDVTLLTTSINEVIDDLKRSQICAGERTTNENWLRDRADLYFKVSPTHCSKDTADDPPVDMSGGIVIGD